MIGETINTSTSIPTIPTTPTLISTLYLVKVVCKSWTEVNEATLHTLFLKVSRLQLLIDDDFDPNWLVGSLSRDIFTKL